MELNAVRRLTIEATSRGVKEATGDLRQLSSAQQGVAVTSDRTAKATLSLDAALERSRRGLDAEYRATASARRETELWNRALHSGQIALSEHSTRLSQIAAKYEMVGAAARTSRAGMGMAGVGGIGMVGTFAGGVLGGAASIALPMIASKAREAVTAVDDLGDAAERAGVSGARLQTLRYALEQNAGSAESADAAFSRLNKTIGDAAFGNKAALKAFQDLGVEAVNAGGGARDTGAVFDDVAAKLGTMSNTAEAASTASRLFGKAAGPELAALLRQGGAGIEQYSQDIATYSELTLSQADALDKKFKALTQSWTVMFNTAAVKAGTFLFSENKAGPEYAAQQAAQFAGTPAGQLQRAQAELDAVNRRVATHSSGGVAGFFRGTSEFADVERQAQLQKEVARLQAQTHIPAIYGTQPGAAPNYLPPENVGNAGTFGVSFDQFSHNEKLGRYAPAVQEHLTKATKDYVPVRQQATAADNSATTAQDRYADAVDATISKMDEIRGSIKSLIDTALHGGNVLQALGEMLLDLGSTGITNALFGAQGTGAGGILGPMLGSIGLGAPAAPTSLAAAPLAAGATAMSAMTAAPSSGAGGPGWGSAIASSAAKFGIDPSIMTTVGKKEALGSSWQSQVRTASGSRETSWGPFQLLTGGGLGDAFQKQTGLDLSNSALFNNPANMQKYTDFVAQQASIGGWGPWHGWKGAPWAGIGGGIGDIWSTT